MGDLFRWPYEVREALPEHGVFVVKDGVPYGPTTEQAIRGGVLAQVVRHPVPTLLVGYGILVDPSEDGSQISISVDPGILGAGGAATSLTDHWIAQASNNARVILAVPGQVTGWSVFCKAFYPIYVKLFDKTGPPTPGSDTVQQTISCQAGLPNVLALPSPLPFSTGIAMAIVKGLDDSDNTDVAAEDCVVDIFYQ